MRIVHVETGRHVFGGARQVLSLASGLAEHDVDSVLVCADDSDVVRAAGEAGLVVRATPMAGDADAAFVLRLRQLLNEIKPDLVHVHSRRGADWYGGLAAASAAVPAVLTRRVDRPERRWPARIKYARYARIIAISTCIRNQLAALGLPRERLALIHSAVDAHRCAPDWTRARFRREFGLADGQPVIAVVAQLIARKGHRYLLPVVADLRDAFPDLRVLCFGSGALDHELRQAVERAGLQSVLEFAGVRTDLTSFLGHVDLVLHPALREGLGVALLEAQAAGVPVVAFRAGGVGEVVVDGQTGRLVTTGDTKAMAEAVRALLVDKASRDRMAAAARQWIAKEFTVGNMVRENLRVYREVLEERRG